MILRLVGAWALFSLVVACLWVAVFYLINDGWGDE